LSPQARHAIAIAPAHVAGDDRARADHDALPMCTSDKAITWVPIYTSSSMTMSPLDCWAYSANRLTEPAGFHLDH
jgi:hypothetical protein